jgi:uncharacterized damage-inducible protein DinB
MSTAINVIKASLETSAFVVNAFLEDLEDEHLFLRPAETANHIAWQLGHLISAEHQMTTSVCPGSMPDLPEGFAERYTKDTASIDDPAQFHSKSEYRELMQQQRAATIAALEKLGDDELDAPAPEAMREYVPTVGAVFALHGTHAMMHAGQWTVVRRQLGRPPLF